MSYETLSALEDKNEELSQQISIEEKKALIHEARKKYGTDWIKLFRNNGSNKGSGMDWNALRFRLS